MLLKGKGLKVNIHTHASSNTKKRVEIINLTPDEFPQELDKYKCYSIGIHPWDITDDYDSLLPIIEKHLQYPNVIAVGEIGLDKNCGTELEIQEHLFQLQLNLAAKYKKPVILHTVKAYSETLSVRKKNPENTWIMHGFNANEYIAGELLKTDTYLSFGALLLNEKSKCARLIDLYPINKILFETDDNSDITIDDIYTEAAGKLNTEIHTLEQQIIKNFNTIFREI